MSSAKACFFFFGGGKYLGNIYIDGNTMKLTQNSCNSEFKMISDIGTTWPSECGSRTGRGSRPLL